MRPQLSVVIPAYNISAYIGDAISSALSQTISDIEVIVVDDGSTDSTPDVIASFDDPRLRVVRKRNGGLSSARNAGIQNATAECIGFLDGDDRWHPEKARRQLAVMRERPDVGLTFCYSRYIDESGHPVGSILLTGPSEPTLHQVVVRNVLGNGSTPIIRADCFRLAGLFDESLSSCEDWEMIVRILRDTPYRALLIPEVLTDYRVNYQSLSFNTETFIRNVEAAVKIIEQKSPNVPASCIRRGLAMSHRIAGSKAAKDGRNLVALKLIRKSLTIYPASLVTDPRLVATLAAMIAPKSLTLLAHRCLAWKAGVLAKPKLPDWKTGS
jgi:glycosyltransferase involved in cell wall biosynthesis